MLIYKFAIRDQTYENISLFCDSLSLVDHFIVSHIHIKKLLMISKRIGLFYLVKLTIEV